MVRIEWLIVVRSALIFYFSHIKERHTTAKVSYVELNANESFPEVGDECIVMGWVSQSNM